MIEREITFNYNEKKFNIKFPNVGQMIDIEGMKNSLTRGKYGSFAASGIQSMYLILDMVDTIAFISIMCPKLKKMISSDEEVDYTDMNPEDLKDLIKVYKTEIFPWYSKIIKELYSSSNEAIDEKDK